MATGAVANALTNIHEESRPNFNMTMTATSNGSASRALADELQQAVHGKVLTPASGQDFTAAANSPHVAPMGICQPALVLQPECAEDICAAVRFAREQNLSLAAKGGGHSIMGLWKAQNGLTIDLRSLAAKEGITVDPEGRTARVTGGAVYTEVMAAGAEQNLFIPWGNAANTGMGLALHGGSGLSCRAFGVSADSILSAKVVTADGNLVTADASQNQDLLEGIRGAGGALGIVAELEFRLHDYSSYFGGSKLWLDPNGALFRKVFDFSRVTLTDHPNLGIMLMNVGNPKNGLRMLQLSASYPGGEVSNQDKEAAFKPLAELELEMDAIIILDSLGKLRYPELEMAMTNAVDRSRAANPAHAQFGVSCVTTFDRVSEDFFEAVWDALTGLPPGMTALMQFDFLGGATRHTKSFNPFAGMDLHFLVVLFWHDSAISNAAAVAVCEQKRDNLAKVVTHVQAYANAATSYDGSYLEVQVGGAQKLARLRELKAKYDPDNIFRNHPYTGL